MRSVNRLREVQRNLPTAFSNLHVTFTFGIKPPGPDLKRAFFAGEKADELALEFDQPVKSDHKHSSEFFSDAEKVPPDSATGAVVTLKLKAPSKANTLDYLDNATWSQEQLLRGENGIASLTFCDVPILPNQ